MERRSEKIDKPASADTDQNGYKIPWILRGTLGKVLLVFVTFSALMALYHSSNEEVNPPKNIINADPCAPTDTPARLARERSASLWPSVRVELVPCPATMMTDRPSTP